MIFQNLAVFMFSDRETPNMGYSEIELLSTTAHHRHSNLLRYTPETKSGPWIVTGKWLLENLELITKLKK